MRWLPVKRCPFEIERKIEKAKSQLPEKGWMNH